MKSGNLNLLDLSGLVQAFTGIASRIPLPWLQHLDTKLYHCTVHLDINVYVYQLMHLFIGPREH